MKMVKRRNAIIAAIVSFICGAIASFLVSIIVLGYAAKSAMEQMDGMIVELNAANKAVGYSTATQPEQSTQPAVSQETLENSQKAANDMLRALGSNDEATKNKAFSNLVKQFNNLTTEMNRNKGKQND